MAWDDFYDFYDLWMDELLEEVYYCLERGVWIDRKSKHHRIKNMSIIHLKNAINWLETRDMDSNFPTDEYLSLLKTALEKKQKDIQETLSNLSRWQTGEKFSKSE